MTDYHFTKGIQGRDRETVFVKGIEGLFDALHISDVQERAEGFLRSFSRHVFTIEARRTHAEKVVTKRWPGHMFGLYLDALPHALARSDEQQALAARGSSPEQPVGSVRSWRSRWLLLVGGLWRRRGIGRERRR